MIIRYIRHRKCIVNSFGIDGSTAAAYLLYFASPTLLHLIRKQRTRRSALSSLRARTSVPTRVSIIPSRHPRRIGTIRVIFFEGVPFACYCHYYPECRRRCRRSVAAAVARDAREDPREHGHCSGCRSGRRPPSSPKPSPPPPPPPKSPPQPCDRHSQLRR